MGGMIAGARSAPTFDPELNMLVAKARSLFGNHSAVALMAEGKFPPSLSPSAILAARKPVKLMTRACAIAARLHAAMDIAYPILVPNRSTNQPKPRRPAA